jgi:hypothetical protein
MIRYLAMSPSDDWRVPLEPFLRLLLSLNGLKLHEHTDK